MMDLHVFAQNVQLHRKDKGWSQEELAHHLNVTRQAVSRWENAQSVPDIDVLLAMSDLFSVTVNDLMEKPHGRGIRNIEELGGVDEGIVRSVILAMKQEQVLIAAKGVSPEVQNLLCHVVDYPDFLPSVKAHGPVMISDVEQTHQEIVRRINEALAR